MKFFKGLFFLLLMILMLNNVKAQQKHFIYIQSADKQPFAVVLNGKVYSSSDYGYAIVSKLTDGEYNFTVSFPMNKYPDQNFKCTIDKKDVGFTLQNTAGSGWSLQNLQTQKTLATSTGAASTNTTAGNNTFGDMLSQVVRDSNLNNKNLPVTKTDTTTANNNAVADTTSAVNSVPTNVPAANVPVAAVATATGLQKISESKQETGTDMIFVDNSKAGADTIKVFVPSDSSTTNMPVSTKDNAVQPSVPASNNIDSSTQQKTANTTSPDQTITENTDTSKHDVSNPFYKSNDQNKNNTTAANASIPSSNTNDVTATAPKNNSVVKSDCSYTITDNDLDKIKRKMFVQRGDYNMVQAAVKYLNNKCITTEQVKTLGNLFSSDDGRYSLYDALYKSTYDYGNYASLESQILDPYYKRRFETMLR